MATRRMRIKAVINVPRGGIKAEPPDQPPPALPTATASAENIPGGGCVPLSPASVLSPRICSGPVSPSPATSASIATEPFPYAHIPPLELPLSPGLPSSLTLANLPARAGTPPVEKPPSSPKSPASWQLQRPSPSKSPAGLPPSGSILRRSPSPAMMNTTRLSNSPGPPGSSSPIKSPIPCYYSQKNPALEAVKFISRTPVIVMPSSSISLGTRPTEGSSPYSPAPASETNVKSPSYFRPPPSPSPSHQDFYSVKSPPGVISRPSPAQSPVFGASGLRPSSSFLSHHFNSNSNSADSHEVAALMSSSSNVPSPMGGSLYPPSPDKSQRHSGRESIGSRGSENSYPGGTGAFSSVSLKGSNYPSFSQSILENPEAMKRRAEERKKDASNSSKFSLARREFFDKFVPGQAPERSKMTMLHFTFYNPPRPDGTGGCSKSGTTKKARSRASSVCSESDSKLGIIIDEKGKAASAPSSIGSRRTTASSGSGGSHVSVQSAHDDNQSEAGSTSSNSSANVPGPRVKVGPDGQLIIDEKSLVVETSESQRARKQIEDMEVVSGANYAVGSSGFYRYKRSYRRGHDWTEKETIRFYRALNQCGTDFSMMQTLFPNRNRQELKSKFKREDRRNPDMVSKALASCHFDPEEGISSDEELALYYGKKKSEELTEKEKLLQEEVEVEQVICSSESSGSPKKRKKKEKKQMSVELTEAQKREIQENTLTLKGRGTGKGKKWNTPVEGLIGKKLPPLNESDVQISYQPSLQVKVEQQTQTLTSVPAKPKKPTGKNKRKSAPPETVEREATVPILVAAGVVQETTTKVKKEKPDPSPVIENSVQAQSPTSSQEMAKGKRRRLPKTKPNLQGGESKKKRTSSYDVECRDGVTAGNSSQNANTSPVAAACDDLFRFDASDPLGFKVVPAPLPVAAETVLEGNEEGREEVVICDLDELNLIAAAALESERNYYRQKSATPKNARRRRRSSAGNTDGIPLASTMFAGDPYGKSIMAVVSPIKKEKESATAAGGSSSSSSLVSVPTNKKVKVLPYRVPGPGGNLPTCQPSLADEFEIEIELNTQSTES